MKPIQLQPSQRVRVIQSIDAGDNRWAAQVEGTVVDCAPHPTGSWHAHGKGDKLWLQRLRLAKDDGEIVDLILDEASVVTPL